MASRHTAARPKRDGETFARTHHHDPSSAAAGAGGVTNKNLRFDPRNPSALAPDRDEDDDENADLLAADVVGRSATIKRNAVNIDGFDSDSDNDNINTQAEARAKKRKKQNKAGDFDKQMDKYDAGEDDDEDDDDEQGSDVDMFAEDKDEADDAQDGADGGDAKKEVRFLEEDEIADQEATSKDRTHISLDPHDRGSSDDDEEEIKLAAAEEAVDDEVGAGGLKRNAPKIEAFNLKQEMGEGRFDQEGNYVRQAADPDARHDSWLSGVSKKDIKKAAEAHEKRQAEANRRRLDEALVQTGDLLGALIARLERGETSLEALARLARKQPPKQRQKKVPQWKLKKQHAKDAADGKMDEDEAAKTGEQQDPEQRRIKAEIDAITDAADKLLARDWEDVYDQERELLQRAYRRETGQDWVPPAEPESEEQPQQKNQSEAGAKTVMWEYRWTDGRGDGAKQGPYDGPTMKAWQDAGYFGEGVEFCEVGDDDGWTRLPDF
jgi:CD2 antigen cytoplasmic tail-binding protein 2